MKTKLLLGALFLTSLMQAQTYTNATAIPLVDGSVGCGSNSLTPGNTSSTITVPITGTITDPTSLTINLDLTHTWIGDLVVDVETPANTKCVLLKRMGATGATPDTDCGDNSNFAAGNVLSFKSSNTTLIDFAAGTTAYNIPTGNYAPTGLAPTAYPNTYTLCDLTTFFNGVAIMGDWKLNVRDSGGGDTGNINSWSLVFTGLSNEEFVFTNAVSVLGNPFENELVVKANDLSTSSALLNLYATDGKLVNQTNVTAFEESTSINTTALSQGVYLLVAEVDGVTQKPIRVIKK
ncbi:MAG: proprotein convertase P-domain-containing protein [Bacteroidota bacterium]